MELVFIAVMVYLVYRLLKDSSKDDPSKVADITIRIGDDSSTSYRRSGRASGPPAKWYSTNEHVSINGYEIPGGLIYVGEVLPDSYGYENDACLVNPKLNVSSAEPWEAGVEMGYWPRYDQIPARCRGAYLKWLADGRREQEAYIGYVFLFFYALERRLLVDGQKGEVSDTERAEIVREVRRLLDIYGSNRSFKGYATNFLATEWAVYRSDETVPEYIDLNDRYCVEPFQLVLAQHVTAGRPIPAEMALQWIALHPDFSLRTPARRCAEEFYALFIRRYAEKFGEGLVVKPNKTPLRFSYRAASPTIRRDLRLKIPELPNPFILSGPLKKLSAIAQECTAELEAYSRYIGRKDNNRNSLAAAALLPSELLEQALDVEKISARLSQVCSSGPGLIPVEELYRSLGEQLPSQFGKKESETLAVLLEAIGFGMAPDVRYHRIKPDTEGMAAIFPKGHGRDFSPSTEFRTLGTIARLGAMVSQIDQDISPSEETLLQSLIEDDRELSRIEKESLQAFLHWCLRTPQTLSGLKQPLSQASVEEKAAISHILISVAHADGRIDPKEVKQLEKLYGTLGLEKEQVINDIHALTVSNGPVTVSRREAEITYSIPTPTHGGAGTGGFRLNEELIRIREEETRQVKGVLETIFSDQDGEEDQEQDNVALSASQAAGPLKLLDEAHHDFFHRLQAQETWSREAVREICDELGLMADGAMEVINEWAFEHANAALIDDGEPIYVDVNLAREIING